MARHAPIRAAARAAAFVLLLGMSGCSEDNAMAQWLSGTPRTSDRKVVFATLAMAEAAAGDPRLGLLLDVRPEAADFQREHIPGAVHFPIQDLRLGDPRLGGLESTIIVYSEGVGDEVSRAATKKLLRLGYTKAVDFHGGLAAWRQAKASGASGKPGDGAKPSDGTAPPTK